MLGQVCALLGYLYHAPFELLPALLHSLGHVLWSQKLHVGKPLGLAKLVGVDGYPVDGAKLRKVLLKLVRLHVGLHPRHEDAAGVNFFALLQHRVPRLAYAGRSCKGGDTSGHDTDRCVSCYHCAPG